MKGIVLALILLLVAGKSQAAHPQPIAVPEGDNVTIVCQSHPTINLEEYTLDVKRADGNSSDRVVCSRRHGKDHPIPQMEQYRNRVFLIIDDLRMGVMRLVIRSVQLSDSGQYKCYIPRLRSASIFTIVVKGKRTRTRMNDFTTTATAKKEMTDENETGAAAKKRHHQGDVMAIVLILCLLVGVAVLVVFRKRICMYRKDGEGNSFELKTLNGQSKEGDEEGQLKQPGGAGELAG